MESLLLFAKTASPVALLFAIVIGLLHVVILLLKNTGIIKKIQNTQQTKYPEMEKYFLTMKELEGQNKLLLENHFKHEVPEMRADIKEIKDTVIFIKDNHGNRLTALEKDVEYIKK